MPLRTSGRTHSGQRVNFNDTDSDDDSSRTDVSYDGSDVNQDGTAEKNRNDDRNQQLVDCPDDDRCQNSAPAIEDVQDDIKVGHALRRDRRRRRQDAPLTSSQEFRQDVESEIGTLKTKISDYETDLEALKDLLRKKKTKLDEADEKVALLEDELSDFKEESEDTERENLDLKEQVDDLQERLKQLEEDNDGLEYKIEELDEENEGLRDEKNNLNDDLNNLQTRLEETKSTYYRRYASTPRSSTADVSSRLFFSPVPIAEPVYIDSMTPSVEPQVEDGPPGAPSKPPATPRIASQLRTEETLPSTSFSPSSSYIQPYSHADLVVIDEGSDGEADRGRSDKSGDFNTSYLHREVANFIQCPLPAGNIGWNIVHGTVIEWDRSNDKYKVQYFVCGLKPIYENNLSPQDVQLRIVYATEVRRLAPPSLLEYRVEQRVHDNCSDEPDGDPSGLGPSSEMTATLLSRTSGRTATDTTSTIYPSANENRVAVESSMSSTSSNRSGGNRRERSSSTPPSCSFESRSNNGDDTAASKNAASRVFGFGLVPFSLNTQDKNHKDRVSFGVRDHDDKACTTLKNPPYLELPTTRTEHHKPNRGGNANVVSKVPSAAGLEAALPFRSSVNDTASSTLKSFSKTSIDGEATPCPSDEEKGRNDTSVTGRQRHHLVGYLSDESEAVNRQLTDFHIFAGKSTPIQSAESESSSGLESSTRLEKSDGGLIFEDRQQGLYDFDGSEQQSSESHLAAPHGTGSTSRHVVEESGKSPLQDPSNNKIESTQKRSPSPSPSTTSSASSRMFEWEFDGQDDVGIKKSTLIGNTNNDLHPPSETLVAASVEAIASSRSVTGQQRYQSNEYSHDDNTGHGHAGNRVQVAVANVTAMNSTRSDATMDSQPRIDSNEAHSINRRHKALPLRQGNKVRPSASASRLSTPRTTSFPSSKSGQAGATTSKIVAVPRTTGSSNVPANLQPQIESTRRSRRAQQLGPESIPDNIFLNRWEHQHPTLLHPHTTTTQVGSNAVVGSDGLVSNQQNTDVFFENKQHGLGGFNGSQHDTSVHSAASASASISNRQDVGSTSNHSNVENHAEDDRSIDFPFPDGDDEDLSNKGLTTTPSPSNNARQCPRGGRTVDTTLGNETIASVTRGHEALPHETTGSNIAREPHVRAYVGLLRRNMNDVGEQELQAALPGVGVPERHDFPSLKLCVRIFPDQDVRSASKSQELNDDQRYNLGVIFCFAGIRWGQVVRTIAGVHWLLLYQLQGGVPEDTWNNRLLPVLKNKKNLERFMKGTTQTKKLAMVKLLKDSFPKEARKMMKKRGIPYGTPYPPPCCFDSTQGLSRSISDNWKNNPVLKHHGYSLNDKDILTSDGDPMVKWTDFKTWLQTEEKEGMEIETYLLYRYHPLEDIIDQYLSSELDQYDTSIRIGRN